MANAPAAVRPAADRERGADELETILTSFDTNYVWNYGSLKEGLRDLYEKAKREQWNGTQQLRLGHGRRSRERDHPRGLQPARRTMARSSACTARRSRTSATRRSRGSSRSSCTASRAR